jgi:hypothetical protein
LVSGSRVAATFELGGHHEAPQLLRVLQTRVVDRVEEEQLLAVGVDPGDVRDRAAERPAQRRIAVFRLRNAGELVEVVDGVESFVALIRIRGAVVLRAAALGDEVHLGAALEPVLGGISAHLDLDFGNGIEIGRAAEVRAATAAPTTITAVHAVDVDGLARASRAANDGHRGRKAAAKRLLIVREVVVARDGDTRKDLQERNRVAAANRQVGDLSQIELRFLASPREVERFAQGGDADGLVHVAHFEPQGPDRQTAVGGDDVVPLLQRLEP